MKHWLINYSVRYDRSGLAGDEEECLMNVSAGTIREAYEIALDRVQNRMESDEIYEAVIWSIGIVEDNVWDDEDD